MNFAKISLCCVAAVLSVVQEIDALSLKMIDSSDDDAYSDSSDEERPANMTDNDWNVRVNKRVARSAKRGLNMIKEIAADALVPYLVANSNLKRLSENREIDSIEISEPHWDVGGARFKFDTNRMRIFFNTARQSCQSEFDKGREIPTPSLYAMIKDALPDEQYACAECRLVVDSTNYLIDDTTLKTEMNSRQQALFEVLKSMVLQMAYHLQKNPAEHVQRVKDNLDLAHGGASATSHHENISLVNEFNYLIFEAEQLRTRSNLVEYGLLPSEANLSDVGNKLDSFTMKKLFDLFLQYFVNRSSTDRNNRGSLFLGPKSWDNFYAAVEETLQSEKNENNFCTAVEGTLEFENENEVSPVNDVSEDDFSKNLRAECHSAFRAGGCSTTENRAAPVQQQVLKPDLILYSNSLTKAKADSPTHSTTASQEHGHTSTFQEAKETKEESGTNAEATQAVPTSSPEVREVQEGLEDTKTEMSTTEAVTIPESKLVLQQVMEDLELFKNPLPVNFYASPVLEAEEAKVRFLNNHLPKLPPHAIEYIDTKLLKKFAHGRAPIKWKREFLSDVILKLQPLLLIIDRYNLPTDLDYYTGFFLYTYVNIYLRVRQMPEYKARNSEILSNFAKFAERFTQLKEEDVQKDRAPLISILQKHQGEKGLWSEADVNSSMSLAELRRVMLLAKDSADEILTHMKRMNEESTESVTVPEAKADTAAEAVVVTKEQELDSLSHLMNELDLVDDDERSPHYLNFYNKPALEDEKATVLFLNNHLPKLPPHAIKYVGKLLKKFANGKGHIHTKRQFVADVVPKLQLLLLIINRYNLPTDLENYTGFFLYTTRNIYLWSHKMPELKARNSEILSHFAKFAERFTQLKGEDVQKDRAYLISILQKYEGEKNLWSKAECSSGVLSMSKDSADEILTHMKRVNEESEESMKNENNENRTTAPSHQQQKEMHQVEV